MSEIRFDPIMMTNLQASEIDETNACTLAKTMLEIEV